MSLVMNGKGGVQMDRNNYCGTCKYHRIDKNSGDWICTNPESEYFADYTDYADWCEEWEEK